jgi:hypothetical protein
MENAGMEAKLLILDACRNNPFGRAWTRSLTRGLATMETVTGALIAYGTGPGKVALEGTGRNSPYTKGLLQQLPIPGQPVEQMFKAVRVAVQQETRGEQTPWEASSLSGDLYLAGASGALTPPTPSTPLIPSPPPPATVDSQAGGGCFIATAAFGTPMAQEVQILREFRDTYLLTNRVGQVGVALYNRYSPPIADFLRHHAILRGAVRLVLRPVITVSQFWLHSSTAHKMLAGVLVALLVLALGVWTTKALLQSRPACRLRRSHRHSP